VPASCSLSAAMICSSVNLLLRILSSFIYPEDCQFTTGTVFGGQVSVTPNVTTVNKKITVSPQPPGELTVIKNVVNDDGGTAVPGDWTMDITGSGVFPNNFPGQSGAGIIVTLDAGAYNVAESGGPSGYAATFSPGCSGTIAGGESRICTITNNDIQPSITVIKTVINDHGGTAVSGDWTMNITGTNVSSTGFAGSTAPGTKITLNAGVYSVTESGGPSGYAANFGNDCSGTIAIGESRICTITNDDVQPSLTVIKNVVNDNGGTAVPGDWTMDITGTDVSPNK